MQFTQIIISLVLAVAGVQAAPAAAEIVARQDVPLVYVQYFNDTRCSGTETDDQVFALTTPPQGCQAVPVSGPIASTKVISNTEPSNCVLRFYSVLGCSEASAHFDVVPGNTGCHAQTVKSAQFVCH